ncbi:FAD-binding oxidoreductase [Rhizobium leguminosarum]|uniref:FAD-binding oxidoreductase n=1 Tax=Rhizobium leguminosarum TaxID=384 RepID=UPI001C95EB18|nr:FAD-binding oxidoreductase [Rhizobium leguminosarum]
MAGDMRKVEEFFANIAAKLGGDAVNRTEETINRYSENTMPGGSRPPLGVVYPRSTDEVQIIVRAANEFDVALYPVSTGNNIGLGSRSPVHAGQVVVDLGRHMNRIIEVNDKLGYAVVEPGVSYQAMYDELVRQGNKYMIDVTSGPPQGGVMGNALDKGAGYAPYFDHFGMSCGMEVVLGNGEILRTGDGALATGNLLNWHTSKYSYGPIIDGLFTQSNYGIVTRMGMWLMPRPPAIRSFHFTYEDDDALEEITDICRMLKMSNYVPTLFRVANDLYTCGAEVASEEFTQSGGQKSISDAGRKRLRQKFGLGSWTVSGAFYGPSKEAMEPQIQRVRDLFGRSGKAQYISHEDAEYINPLKVAINAFSGVPSASELGLLRWRPGGGNTWFLPGTPTDGQVANEFQKVGRAIYEKHGMDYMVMNVCAARFMRGLHVITFNREDEDECRRADACYRELSEELVRRGVFVGRAPIDYQKFHMDQTTDSFRDACSGIKNVFDPKGIIAPGRYGIGE